MMDVAAAAGVSQTTVSLVLNNIVEARLSASTRQRVREAARDARLHPAAATRRRGPPRVGATAIGFVADEISTDPWCAMQLDAVREKAWEHGLTVTAGVSHGDPELEAALLERMLREPLVGLIYATILTRPIRPLRGASAARRRCCSTATCPTTRSPRWCRASCSAATSRRCT